MPVSLAKIILNIRVIVAAVGSAAVDHDALQLVLEVFRVVRHRHGVGRHELRHVKLERVLELVVQLLALPRFIVKLETVQAQSQHGRKLADLETLARVRLLATTLGTIARQLVVTLELLECE